MWCVFGACAVLKGRGGGLAGRLGDSAGCLACVWALYGGVQWQSLGEQGGLGEFCVWRERLSVRWVEEGPEYLKEVAVRILGRAFPSNRSAPRHHVEQTDDCTASSLAACHLFAEP